MYYAIAHYLLSACFAFIVVLCICVLFNNRDMFDHLTRMYFTLIAFCYTLRSVLVFVSTLEVNGIETKLILIFNPIPSFIMMTALSISVFLCYLALNEQGPVFTALKFKAIVIPLNIFMAIVLGSLLTVGLLFNQNFFSEQNSQSLTEILLQLSPILFFLIYSIITIYFRIQQIKTSDGFIPDITSKFLGICPRYVEKYALLRTELKIVFYYIIATFIVRSILIPLEVFTVGNFYSLPYYEPLYYIFLEIIPTLYTMHIMSRGTTCQLIKCLLNYVQYEKIDSPFITVEGPSYSEPYAYHTPDPFAYQTIV